MYTIEGLIEVSYTRGALDKVFYTIEGLASMSYFLA